MLVLACIPRKTRLFNSYTTNNIHNQFAATVEHCFYFQLYVNKVQFFVCLFLFYKKLLIIHLKKTVALIKTCDLLKTRYLPFLSKDKMLMICRMYLLCECKCCECFGLNCLRLHTLYTERPGQRFFLIKVINGRGFLFRS